MRFPTSPRTTLPILLAAMTLAPLPGSAQTDSDDVEAVRAVLESLSAYAQAGDLDAMGALYAPGGGVHIIEGAGVNHGWEDYRDHHLAPELASFENFEYRYFSIEPVVRGEVAYSAFRYELKADTPDGHVEAEGRGTAVLERMDGAWKIVHTHTSGRRR